MGREAARDRHRGSRWATWGLTALVPAALVVVVSTASAFDPVAPRPTGPCASQSLPKPMAEQPGPTNTGVPAGTRLRTIVGDYHTREDGEAVTGLRITGRLYVDNDRVTVRCTSVRRMTVNRGHGLRIWLSSLGDPRGVGEGSALKWSDYTLRRVDVRGTYDGLKAQGNVDVRDSYLHDMFRAPDPKQANGWTHNDAVQIDQGEDMVFSHNTIYAWTFAEGERAGAHLFEGRAEGRAGYMTSAFMVIAREPVRNVLIERNLIRGSYTRFLFRRGPITGLLVVANDVQYRGAYADQDTR